MDSDETTWTEVGTLVTGLQACQGVHLPPQLDRSDVANRIRLVFPGAPMSSPRVQRFRCAKTA
jgi:hypothetical protein